MTENKSNLLWCRWAYWTCHHPTPSHTVSTRLEVTSSKSLQFFILLQSDSCPTTNLGNQGFSAMNINVFLQNEQINMWMRGRGESGDDVRDPGGHVQGQMQPEHRADSSRRGFLLYADYKLREKRQWTSNVYVSLCRLYYKLKRVNDKKMFFLGFTMSISSESSASSVPPVSAGLLRVITH